MKITKRQLKRIIREEKQKLLENVGGWKINQASEQIEEILNGLSNEGVDNKELIQILQALVADINNGFIGEPS